MSAHLQTPKGQLIHQPGGVDGPWVQPLGPTARPLTCPYEVKHATIMGA